MRGMMSQPVDQLEEGRGPRREISLTGIGGAVVLVMTVGLLVLLVFAPGDVERKDVPYMFAIYAIPLAMLWMARRSARASAQHEQRERTTSDADFDRLVAMLSFDPVESSSPRLLPFVAVAVVAVVMVASALQIGRPSAFAGAVVGITFLLWALRRWHAAQPSIDDRIVEQAGSMTADERAEMLDLLEATTSVEFARPARKRLCIDR